MKEKNIFSLITTAGGMVFLQAINFLIAILLARYLTPGEFGKFQLLFTIVTTLAIIAKLGMDEGFIFFIAKIKKYNESVNLHITYILMFVTFTSISLGLFIRNQHSFIDQYIISQFNFKYELELILFYVKLILIYGI